jgi:prevent-host-death family protein
MTGEQHHEGNRIDIAWPLAEAKARLSELIDKVEKEGPQVISRRGKDVAVVVAVEEWREKGRRKGSLAQFFAESPLHGAQDLVVERAEFDFRDVEL